MHTEPVVPATRFGMSVAGLWLLQQHLGEGHMGGFLAVVRVARFTFRFQAGPYFVRSRITYRGLGSA